MLMSLLAPVPLFRGVTSILFTLAAKLETNATGFQAVSSTLFQNPSIFQTLKNTTLKFKHFQGIEAPVQTCSINQILINDIR